MVAGTAAAAIPRVGDFSCYAVSGPPPRGDAVVLRDEFRSERGRLTTLFRFCKPAKTGTAKPGRTHLSCYAVSPKRALTRSVVVRNRFGLQELSVTGSDSYCAPATSSTQALRLVRGPDPKSLSDSFRCYRSAAATPFRVRRLRVTDGFRERVRMTIRKPVLLCNPASTQRGSKRSRVRNPAARLVCYDAAPRTTIGRAVLILNEVGLFELRVRRADVLCLSSTKEMPPPPTPPPPPPPPPPDPPPPPPPPRWTSAVALLTS